MSNRLLAAFTGAVALTLVAAPFLTAQSFRRGGHEFEALRPVNIAGSAAAQVIVVSFWHHGVISTEGDNVVVAAGNTLVPTRVLQLGPGDFCRLAFQPTAGGASYEILYGGEALAEGTVPEWTATAGLLLETREYQDCNLNSLDSIRQAFAQAKAIGADYVDGVAHAGNPFEYQPGPYMSHYSGRLHVGSTGTYGFLTTSQDASFLLIDGEVVVSQPGRHRPERWARPEMRKDIQLTAGAHRFEYYHVATTAQGMAVAAWEVSPQEAKPKPSAIPPEAFRADQVAHVESGRLTTAEQGLVPDFDVQIVCDIPLPDSDVPLVAVRFLDNSPPPLLMNSRVSWDFGDGQTSQELSPTHVFLRPGLYAVRETLRRAGRDFDLVNRVYIHAPRLTNQDKEKLLSLDDVLPLLDQYDPAQLDAISLQQLVDAYLFKADEYLPPPEPDSYLAADPEAEEEPEESRETPQEREEREESRRRYLLKAIEAGKVALVGKSAATGDQALVELAEKIAPLARQYFVDAKLAGQIWYGAAQQVQNAELRARCEIAAADVAVNDMNDTALAGQLLEAAEGRVSDDTRNRHLLAKLYRVRGDLRAAEGEGEAARRAYRRADSLLAESRSHIERTAWQGAYSRSVEDFLRDGRLYRAIQELHKWKDDFPADVIEGYLPLLEARYWHDRGKHELVPALADRLLAVNPYSPYIDKLLFLSARSDVARGEMERAAATLESLLQEYPGSPLVPEVKEYLAGIESGEITPPVRRPGRSR